MRSAALWLWLCALALRPPPALAQIVTTNVPPEDQDSSGDDSDFSGSGAGALQDITLSHQTPSTWKDPWLLTTTPKAPEPTGTDAAPTSTPTAVEGPVEEHAVVLAEAEPDLTAKEKETTHPPRGPTQHPATPQGSTARATTAQAPTTTRPHRDTQPEHPETLAPTEPSRLDLQVLAMEDGASSPFPAEEGSGEQDFIFETSEESMDAVEPGPRSQQPEEPGSPGASQGLLDRKEVLGGVIAGGVVGLIFAVCLVGFMLYRMKKKDEGSYSLEEPKQANGGAYQKPSKQEEFYA
ncbi:syndecan-1 [Choloepus didactylus]|uniref:syndecan-1 n=1 Tax=Choloepus didactylus TaxID=27675 RepID=UPI0018A05C1F|nr:syndecan-1 [Choloepus didactylus]